MEIETNGIISEFLHAWSQVVVSFQDKAQYLAGMESNDEACGCVFYVVLEPDQATSDLVGQLRAEIGLEPLPRGAHSHLTIAGVAPRSGKSVSEMRKLFDK